MKPHETIINKLVEMIQKRAIQIEDWKSPISINYTEAHRQEEIKRLSQEIDCLNIAIKAIQKEYQLPKETKMESEHHRLADLERNENNV